MNKNKILLIDDNLQTAKMINTKQKSISLYETSSSVPSLETLVKIAKALKKPAGHFLDE